MNAVLFAFIVFVGGSLILAFSSKSMVKTSGPRRYEDKQKPAYLDKMHQSPEEVETQKVKPVRYKKRRKQDRDMFISDNDDFEI
jgi:hypothetical protein